MRKHRLFALFLSILLLTGCHKVESVASKPKVVTGITVTYENAHASLRRYYTSDFKIRSILNYLRWIDPFGPPEENPEMVSGNSIRITLSYSNGSEKRYWQKSDRYLLEEGKSWQAIDPTKAMTLSRMVGEMESDR